MVKRAFLLLPLACCLASAAWAADHPMMGDWKLNPQKSRLVDEMKVTSLGGNKDSFDFGSGSAETIVADGTDQPGIMQTTFAVTPVSPEQWTVVRKKDGREMIRATWTLGKDGKTLQDDYTQVGDNGQTTHLVYHYDRRGGDSGFAGDWVSTTQQIDTVYDAGTSVRRGWGLDCAPLGGGYEKREVRRQGLSELGQRAACGFLGAAREREDDLADG